MSVAALDQIDKLERKKDVPFPYDMASDTDRRARLDFLISTREKFSALANCLFIGLVCLAFRILLYAFTPAGICQTQLITVKYIFDGALSLALVVLVVGMWFMHSRSKIKDAEIRERAVRSRPELAVPEKTVLSQSLRFHRDWVCFRE